MKKQTVEQRRISFMQQFEDAVKALDPLLARRIEWESAHHFFYTGKDPKDAAQGYVAARTTI